MLKFLDVLIGLSTVMLLVSMVVMAVTHFIMAALKTRSRNLKSRLSELLGQIDPALAGDVGKKIADAVLSKGQLKSAIGNANAVNREQFTRALFDLAGDKSSFEAKDLLRKAMKDAGIDDPDKTLENIHSLAFELERQNPDLAQNVRYNLAILQEAERKFVNRIHAWFDNTMDRASEKFKVQSRIWTYGVALAIALFLQLDTIQIANRLAIDDVFRAAMVSEAQSIVKQSQVVAEAHTLISEQDKKAVDYANATLTKCGIVVLPRSYDEWAKSWTGDWFNKLIGIFLSTVLLSLGAPFWYNALANLLQLRSVVAQKDDQQRAARAAQPTPEVAAAVAAQRGAPSWMKGEQGNPHLVG